jgi:hypothetical protein
MIGAFDGRSEPDVREHCKSPMDYNVAHSQRTFREDLKRVPMSLPHDVPDLRMKSTGTSSWNRSLMELTKIRWGRDQARGDCSVRSSTLSGLTKPRGPRSVVSYHDI